MKGVLDGAVKKDQWVEVLQKHEAFADIREDVITWFLQRGRVVKLQAGEYAFRQGERTDDFLILVEGRMEILRNQNGQQLSVVHYEAPAITGVLPFSRMVTTGADGLIREPSVLIYIDKKEFTTLPFVSYELTQNLVAYMTDRVRNYTRRIQQNEKLMALGKLSAGLAHELNNPASAINRAAQELRETIAHTPESFKKVLKLNLTEQEIDRVSAYLFGKLEGYGQGPELPMLEKSAQEDELLEWMDEHEVDDADMYAEVFQEAGFKPAELEDLFAGMDKAAVPGTLGWMNNVLTSEALLQNIGDSAGRIAELVGAVKSYTHMGGGADEQPVNLAEGLKATLRMLAHKLKEGGIQLLKEFDPATPLVKGQPGEMNQVLTNLIDNAIDALQNSPHGTPPTLTLRLRPVDGFTQLEVIDNASGVPEEIQSQIFDPFFTTKGIGKGTGMGLDIARRIIEQHKGSISLKSEPGYTNFCLRFPPVE